MTFGIEIGPELITAGSVVAVMIPVALLLLRLVSSNARDTTAQRSGWSDLYANAEKRAAEAEAREQQQRERAEQCEEVRDSYRNRLEADGAIPPRPIRSRPRD